MSRPRRDRDDAALNRKPGVLAGRRSNPRCKSSMQSYHMLATSLNGAAEPASCVIKHQVPQRRRSVGRSTKRASVQSPAKRHNKNQQSWDDVAVGWIDKVLGAPSPGLGCGAARSKQSVRGALVRAHAEGSGTKPAKQVQVQKVGANAAAVQLGNGLLLLLVANYAIFIADKFFFTNLSNILPLVTSRPQWWQFVTSAFVHQDFQHLSGNMFMLWAFGRSLEVDEGSAGLVAYYLLCALGASAAMWAFNPGKVSLGASGAVFGLYVLSVGVRLANFSFRKLLEVVAITPFVWAQITSNVAAQVTGSGALGLNVAYMAHLGGAAMGLALVILQMLIPDVKEKPAQ